MQLLLCTFCCCRHVHFSIFVHWLYYDLNTSTIISWNQVIVPTPPSARYCTLLKVWGCWMLKQRAAQKIINGPGEKGHCGARPAVLYSSHLLFTCFSCHVENAKTHVPYNNKQWIKTVGHNNTLTSHMICTTLKYINIVNLNFWGSHSIISFLLLYKLHHSLKICRSHKCMQDLQ
jgi:hypothetical protein